MFDVRLRLFEGQGTKGRVLPSVELSVSIQESSSAALSFSVSERVAGRLVAPFLVGVEYSTGSTYQQPRNGLFMVTEEGSDSADVAQTVSFTGVPFVPWLLEGMHQRMNPYVGARYLGAKHEWPNATPGRILRSLIDHGKSVDGWAPMLTTDFTAAGDSAGLLWTNAEKWSPEFARLTSISDVLAVHTDAGLVDWWTEGTTLRVFRPGTGVARPDLKLGGPGFTRMPVKRQFAGQFNFLTVMAEDGSKYYPNPGADQTFGVRHATATFSGVKLADLDRIVQPMLVEGRTPKRELSYEWTPVGVLPVPWRDFQVGDAVTVRDRDAWTVQRVLGVTVQKKDAVTVRVTVGTKLLNRLKNAIDRSRRGSEGEFTGGTGTNVPVSPPIADEPPLAPANVRVVSNTSSWGEDGSALTRVKVGWDAVVETASGALLDDVSYEVWARRASEPSARIGTTGGLELLVEGWEPAVTRYVKVRAISDGRVGPFSGEISVTPPVPSSIVPKAPVGLTVASNVGAFQDDGSAVATVKVTWWPVTQSVDNVPVEVVEYEATVDGNAYRVTAPEVTFTVPTGKTATMRVKARTSLGVWGDLSQVVSVKGAVPPPLTYVPSQPVLGAGMGGVTFRWDGLPTPPKGFGHIVVDTGPSGAGPWTAYGATLNAAGGGSISAGVGDTVFVRFRAFDTLGRDAGTSVVGSATAAGVALSDIPGLDGDLTTIRETADGKNRIYTSASEPVPEKVNLAPNPSFEEGAGTVVFRENLFNPALVNNLALSGGALVGNAAYRGYSLPVTPGEVYSVRRKLPLTNRFHVTFTSSVPAAGVAVFGTVTNDVAEAIENVTVPANATHMFIYLSNANEDVAGLLIVKGSAVEAYWDGDGPAPADPDLSTVWTGPVGASASAIVGVAPASVSYYSATASDHKAIRSTVHPELSPHAVRCIHDGGTPTNRLGFKVTGIPLSASTPTTVVGSVYVPAAQFAKTDGTIRVQAVDWTITTIPIVPDQWSEFRVTVSAHQALYVSLNPTSTWDAGDEIWFDDLAIIEGVYDGPYFTTFTQGDLWLKLDAEETSVVQILVWNGAAWVPQVIFAENVIATGSIIGTLIRAGTLEVNHVSPTFGDDLMLSANDSITMLVGRANVTDDTLTVIDGAVQTAQSDATTANTTATVAQNTANKAQSDATNAGNAAEAVSQRLDEHQTYYRFSTTGLAIGDPATANELRLKPDRIEMAQNNVVVSFWEGGVFVADEVRISSAQVSNHKFEKSGDGRTLIRPL